MTIALTTLRLSPDPAADANMYLKSEDKMTHCLAKAEPDSPTSSPGPGSSSGMFHIFGYHPFGGSAGSHITVNIAFNCPTNVTTFLRLVVGRKAMSTAVRAVSGSEGQAWELEALAPLYDDYSPRVAPLSAQALNTDGDVLDSLTFGTFTYYSSSSLLDPMQASQRPDTYASSSSDTEPESSLAVRRSKASSSRQSPYATRSRPAKVTDLQAPAIALTRRSGPASSDAQAPKAVLELGTDLDAMCASWTAEERRSGRRLVRFTRIQQGCVIRTFCEPIRPDEYRHTDAVVSCIRRPDTRGFCITSVDVITLLEHLAGVKFGIDEKNRIRRNLEGFRPKTISKNKASSQKFFQTIMDFPVPKPRNIEKDVKVFDWSILSQALEKIVSKYSLESVDIVESEYSTSPKQEQLPHQMSYSPHEDMHVLEAGLMLSPSHFSRCDTMRAYAMAPQSYPPSPLESPYDTAFPPDSFYPYPAASSLQQPSASAFIDSPYDASGYLVDGGVQSYAHIEPPLDHTSPYIS